ncbi:Dabb family protein [Acrocarpospora pleiomorpha]|nr:Dabb family protein [Acrocarpospora pleiomorpha]
MSIIDHILERKWRIAAELPHEEVAMLIHCVTLKFRDSASAADIETFAQAVAALPGRLDFPIRTRQGRDLGERPANADYAIVTEFETLEDFNAYLVHPAHLALPREPVESMQSVQFRVKVPDA